MQKQRFIFWKLESPESQGIKETGKGGERKHQLDLVTTQPGCLNLFNYALYMTDTLYAHYKCEESASMLSPETLLFCASFL